MFPLLIVVCHASLRIWQSADSSRFQQSAGIPSVPPGSSSGPAQVQNRQEHSCFLPGILQKCRKKHINKIKDVTGDFFSSWLNARIWVISTLLTQSQCFSIHPWNRALWAYYSAICERKSSTLVGFPLASQAMYVLKGRQAHVLNTFVG